MRVLTFTNMYPFAGKPFYGIFVKEEVDSLRAQGCDVDVLFINGLESKLNYFASLSRFRRRLRDKRYDIIHVHHSYCGFVAAFQKRIPLVWTFHEGDIAGDPQARKRDRPIKWLSYSRSFKRWVAERSDALIVVSEHLKEPLGRSDAVTIPCGVDLELFEPMERRQARHELGLDNDKRYVLFPSDPSRVEKRFALAREAVEDASGSVGAIEILILDGIPHERVPLFMNAADVLLMTSSFEASPVTVREALACNLPVVSTDVGDVRSVLEGVEPSRVVDAHLPEISKALAGVLSPPRRSDGRRTVQRYSHEETAKRIIEVYRKVISRRGEGAVGRA